MWFFRAKCWLLALLCLAACQPQKVSLTPPPALIPWQVEYTPALRWLEPLFQTCAAGLPGAALVVQERPAAQLGSAQADFSFQWGDRAAPAGFTAVIGSDELVVVVNPTNPVITLSPDEVSALFSGKTGFWSLRSTTGCASCGPDFEGAVQAYVLAPGEDARAAAAWIPAGPAAILAPGPAEVRAAVAQGRFAVGYLPARWVDATVKKVALQPAAPGQPAQPVLVFAPGEPQGTQRAWLACLQAALR